MASGGADLGSGGKSAEKPLTQHGDTRQANGRDRHMSYIINKLVMGHGQGTKCMTDMLKIYHY